VGGGLGGLGGWVVQTPYGGVLCSCSFCSCCWPVAGAVRFLINYKFLQIYLQAGITFIP